MSNTKGPEKNVEETSCWKYSPKLHTTNEYKEGPRNICSLACGEVAVNAN